MKCKKFEVNLINHGKLAAGEYLLKLTVTDGKGNIILTPCYHVDDDNAFSDMLFYNMIIMAAKGQW